MDSESASAEVGLVEAPAAWRQRRSEVRRERLVDAMIAVVLDRGFRYASVASVCAEARVSRSGFYEAFASCEDCFLGVLDRGYHQASRLIFQAFHRTDCWREGVCAALAALLLFFDAEPDLAWVWLIESLAVGSWALEHRERRVQDLTGMIVGRWPPPTGVELHPLAATSVMTSVLGIVQAHLIAKRPEPLITLLGPLMGVATAPYSNRPAVAAAIEQGEALTCEALAGAHTGQPEEPDSPWRVPDTLLDPRARRARQCVLYLAEAAGASNRQIAAAIGVSSHTQISKLLARLTAMDLLFKDEGRLGHANAWSLTPQGTRVAAALRLQRSQTPSHVMDVGTSHTSASRRDPGCDILMR